VEVARLVAQPLQGVDRLDDRLDALRIGVRLQQHLRHAPGDRQLVAHVVPEHPVEDGDPPHPVPAVGDVAQNPDGPVRFTVRFQGRLQAQLAQPPPVVRRPEHHLHRFPVPAPLGYGPVDMALDHRPLRVREQVRQFVPGEHDQLVVRPDDAKVGIQPEDRVRCRLHDRLELLQLALPLNAVGHVALEAEVVRERVTVVDRRQRQLVPERLAVRPVVLQHQALRFARVDRGSNPLDGLELRSLALEEPAVPTADALRVVAGDRLERRVGVHDRTVGTIHVGDHDPLVGRVHRAPVELRAAPRAPVAR
jgi:hypothetical protein